MLQDGERQDQEGEHYPGGSATNHRDVSDTRSVVNLGLIRPPLPPSSPKKTENPQHFLSEIMQKSGKHRVRMAKCSWLLGEPFLAK